MHDPDTPSTTSPALRFSLPPRQFLDTLAVCDLDYALAEDSRLRRRAHDDASSWFASNVFWDALGILAWYVALTFGLVFAVAFVVLMLSGARRGESGAAWGWSYIYLLPALACGLAASVARPFRRTLAHARLRKSALLSPTKQAQRDLLVQVVSRLRSEHRVEACVFEGRWDAWTLRLVCADGEALTLSVVGHADTIRARVWVCGAPERTVRWGALDLAWAGRPVRMNTRHEDSRSTALLAPMTLRAGDRHVVGARAREDLAEMVVRLMDARTDEAHAARPELLAWDMRAALCDAALPSLVSRRAPSVVQPAGMGVRSQAMSRALVSWFGWGAAVSAGLVYGLLAMGIALVMLRASSAHTVSLGIASALSALWINAVLLAGAVKHIPLWPKRSALAARAPVPDVVAWSTEHLSLGTSGPAIRWTRPFRVEVTRDPEVREGRVLVTLDLRQTAAKRAETDGADVARVRFAVALPRTDALEALPALTTDAPLLHADHFTERVWPLLRDSADAHGVALPQALATLNTTKDNARVVHAEVAVARSGDAQRAPSKAR